MVFLYLSPSAPKILISSTRRSVISFAGEILGLSAGHSDIVVTFSVITLETNILNAKYLMDINFILNDFFSLDVCPKTPLFIYFRLLFLFKKTEEKSV